jgi:hypothetical protein
MLSVSGATIWSFNLELSIKILEASFSLIYDVYGRVITQNMFLAQAPKGLYYKHITIINDASRVVSM